MGGIMILILLGLVIGWVVGIITMAIFAVGKREDALINDMYNKIDWI
jgi:hypothetical protein